MIYQPPPDVWMVDVSRAWPPPGRPTLPISPTLLDNLRECPLRTAFANSPEATYPRRSSPAARVGSAFHKTLERLDRGVIDATQFEQAQFAAEALTLFRQQLAQERAAGSANPRERTLPWPDDRLDRAEAALITAARAVWSVRRQYPASPSETTVEAPRPGAELPVQSRDGRFFGKLDRAELGPSGWRIIDYKTSTAPDQEKHARQIRFYAYLWFDRWGEWPAEGVLHYVFLRREVPVSTDPDECLRLMEEASNWAENVAAGRALTANPGEACTYCEFRPWCSPFWQWASADAGALNARARLGFEGVVRTLRSEAGVHLFELEGLHRSVIVRTPVDQFPQLAELQIGDHLRIVDAPVSGPYGRPTANLGDRTEIFFVVSHPPTPPQEDPLSHA